jgi:hypothetical protein
MKYRINLCTERERERERERETERGKRLGTADE